MDQKTKETILRFLLDDYMRTGRPYYKDLPDLCKDLPRIPENVMRGTLSILKDEGLVNYIIADAQPSIIQLTPAGLAYFEKKKQAKKEKWAERRWSLFQVFIGYVLGFLSGIGVNWIVKTYFK